MASGTAELISLVLAAGLVACTAGWWFGPRGRRARERVEIRIHRARTARKAIPAGRPIEVIAADVRRLSIRFHCMDPHTRFAKAEGIRRAYDGVLAECCAALGVTHLLGVIPPGPELDTERARVEIVLEGAGLTLPFSV